MFKSNIESKLDREINSALDELETLRDKPDKYATVVERISKLHKLKTEEEKTGIQPPSMESVLFVGANIFGILWLARFERTEVIKAPNAFRFIMKPR